jgi:hypothetical protein
MHDGRHIRDDHDAKTEAPSANPEVLGSALISRRPQANPDDRQQVEPEYDKTCVSGIRHNLSTISICSDNIADYINTIATVITRVKKRRRDRLRFDYETWPT